MSVTPSIGIENKHRITVKQCLIAGGDISGNHEWMPRSTVVRIANYPSHDEEEELAEEDTEIKNPEESGGDSETGPETSTPRKTCCGRTRPSSWFSIYLCFGMIGFIVFWLVLMLRIYLPESYWTWSYIW